MTRRRRPGPSPSPIAAVVSQRVTASAYGPTSRPATWSPAINVYQSSEQIDICIDLAGVARQGLDVTVEPGRLIVSGEREAPEPCETERKAPMRIVTMEIDYGPFERVVAIPDRVALTEVSSRYDDGLLWVSLPLNPPPAATGEHA